MRSFYLLLLAVFAIGWPGPVPLQGAEFKLSNGDILRGEAASYDDDGLVVRLEIGGFSPRIGWGKLSQETLKALTKNPQAARFVEPFIELPPTPPEKAQPKKEIVLKPVPRLERPEKSGFFAALYSPAGLALLAILYLANLFAAYEIAVFRGRPAALVCGLSALIPAVGPIIFLSLPTAEEALEPGREMSGAPADASIGPPAAGQAKKTGPAPPPSSLSVAAGDKKGSSTPTAVEGMVFKRGDTTFNRRFFETKFPNFFRIVPSEAEKDLVLVVRAVKNEFVAKRISRISSNEMHLQLLRGGAEAMVTFTEILEVQIRNKDAKA